MNTAVNTVADSVAASDITAGQVWAWLADVPDPEIPVISIVDLGIVRAVDRRRAVAYLPGFWWAIMFIIKSIPEFVFRRIKL